MSEPRTQREKEIYLKGYRDAEKAYVACHYCYGRGYEMRGGKPVPCSCERGKEIKPLLS